MRKLIRRLAVTTLLMASAATFAVVSSNEHDAANPTAMRCMKTAGGNYVCTAP